MVLSVRPGKCSAILAHWFPISAWSLTIVRSSSSVHAPFLILGWRWLWYLSRHCFPERSGMKVATRIQSFDPCSSTIFTKRRSSSFDHFLLFALVFEIEKWGSKEVSICREAMLLKDTEPMKFFESSRKILFFVICVYLSTCISHKVAGGTFPAKIRAPPNIRCTICSRRKTWMIDLKILFKCRATWQLWTVHSRAIYWNRSVWNGCM